MLLLLRIAMHYASLLRKAAHYNIWRDKRDKDIVYKEEHLDSCSLLRSTAFTLQKLYKTTHKHTNNTKSHSNRIHAKELLEYTSIVLSDSYQEHPG